jgi:hypothetical protein
MNALWIANRTCCVLFIVLFTLTSLIQPTVAQSVGPPAPVVKPPQENLFTKAIEKLKSLPGATSNTSTVTKPEKEADKETSTVKTNNTGNPVMRVPGNSPATLNNPGEDTAENLFNQPVEPQRPELLTQPPLEQAKIAAPEIDPNNPPIMDYPKLDDPKNPLGFSYSLVRLKKYSSLVDAKAYSTARIGLSQLRQELVDITEAHIELYKTLSKIPSAQNQAQLEKELALQFAQLRDKAMVESARIELAEQNKMKAVKALVEVVKSQPKSKLGLYAYELLQEAGFTEKLQLAK